MKSLGIIGFGAFGRLAAKELSGKFSIVVADAGKIRESAFPATTIARAAASDIVLLCVPISEIASALRKISPFVKPGALVMDVSSLKVLACKLMATILPKATRIVGTHPLFGPKSVAADGLIGKTIVLCPVRADKELVQKIALFVESLGLEVRRMTPLQHDRDAAKSQALHTFLLKALEKTAIRSATLPLASRLKLLEAMDFVRGDSEQLYWDMQTLNPFAFAQRKNLIALLEKLDNELVRKSWAK